MADRETRRWQARLLPVMTLTLLASAMFFAVIIFVKFDQVTTLLSARAAAPELAWTRPGTEPTNFQQQLELANAQAGYLLEREVMARRYDQGTAAFIGRLWTRLMGFVTGMLLALVGAAFVLGKLEADPSEMAATTSGLAVSLRSASPGLILAGLGVVVMITAIALPAKVTSSDGAVYFGRHGSVVTTVDDGDSYSSADPENADQSQPRRTGGDAE